MKRILLIALAALTAGALVGPSSAFAGRSHLLGTYKVEEHLDLQGEDGTYTISCDGTDIAIDGMWRIDNVDQDNDYVYGSFPSSPANPAWDVLNSVEVVQAEATSDSTYTFRFLPQSGGDVQGKLFLVCLPRKTTQTAGHQHSWTVSPQGSTSCTSGSELAVAPSFNFTSGSGHLFYRWPASGSADDPTSWGQQFVTLGGAVTTSWSCLTLKSSTVNGHAHRVVPKYRRIDMTTPSTFDTVPANAVSEHQVICGEHYKLALGAFRIANPLNVWYLGMDPRPKTRAFKMLNDTLAPDGGTEFAGICFKDSTT